MALEASSSFDFFVVWAFLIVPYTAAFEIEIKPPGEKFVKAFNTNAVFSCHVTGTSGESDVGIQWVDQNARPIPENLGNRIYVEKGSDYTRKLYITAIEARDAGKYSCFVTVGGRTEQKSIELFNFKDITFDHAPNPQHPKNSCDAVIECKVTGNPTPVVSWRFNGKPAEGDRYEQVTGGLLIKTITQADNGNYTCRAEVEADGRYDERIITVIVHIPPDHVLGPGDIHGIEGQSIAMSCKSNGLPPPKFEFSKKNKANDWMVLSASDRILVDADFGRVEFRPLMKEDDGVYLCKALNDVGEKSSNGTVRVFVPPKVHDLQNQTLVEGESAILSCKSLGDPPPTLTFRKTGLKEEYKNGSNDGGRIVVTEKGPGQYELRIKKLLPADSGSYVCQAQNLAGKHMATGGVNVHYKPRFPGDQPRAVYSWAGRLHNITCRPEGEPKPTVEWRRADRVLENNDTFHIFNIDGFSSLQVRVKEADQSWIYGDYVCRASNVEGSTDFKIVLNRATVPDAPQNVTVKVNHPNHILLAIEPPKDNGGVRLVGYRVEYDNKVYDFSILETESRGANGSHKPYSAELMSIDNLRPATKYVFRVRAKNEVGVGNKIERTVTTANFSKPFPIHLTSPEHGWDSSQYKITWEKPNTGGKPITEYQIRYKEVRVVDDGRGKTDVFSKEDWIIQDKVDHKEKPMLEFSLSGLSPNTYYKLEVLAKNDFGYSKPERDFFFRTGALPLMAKSSQATSLLLNLLWLPSFVILKIVAGLWTGFE